MQEYGFRTHVYVGTDSLKKLNEFKNQRILLVCDAFLPGTPVLKKIEGEIDKSSKYEIFSDVKPNPPLKNVMEGIQMFLKLKPSVIVGIGGGSAMDTAKGIRFFGEKISKAEIGCFVAIPTTSGTGSEVSNWAVISDPDEKKKYPLDAPALTPDVALLDPNLVKTAPKGVTSASGMDVLTHALEALVAKHATLFSDALAEEAIDVITNCLVECYRNGDDMKAREIVHQASNIAGIAFSNAGLGIVHAISHQLTANFHVPHGLANTMLLPYVIAYNTTHCKEAMHKVAVATKKAGIVSPTVSDKLAVERMIGRIRQMARQMHCPMTLKDFGVEPNKAFAVEDAVIADAKADATYPGNPVEPSDEDLKKIYEAIIR